MIVNNEKEIRAAMRVYLATADMRDTMATSPNISQEDYDAVVSTQNIALAFVVSNIETPGRKPS
jgi:hypothetical protein